MSTRRYSKRVSEEEKLINVLTRNEEDYFKVLKINEIIGYGVFSKTFIPKNEPILVYKGDNISTEEAEKRRLGYDNNGISNCFIYELHFMGLDRCIDATNVNGLGRMVNDSSLRYSNCTMKKKQIHGDAFLILYSLSDINAGDELRYDYGIKGCWRKMGLYPKPLTEAEVMNRNNCNDCTGAVPIAETMSNNTKKQQESISCVSDFNIGEVFKDPIGGGAAADVFFHKLNGEIVAVKKFKIKILKKKLVKVSNKIGKLKHPNVVQLLGTSLDISALIFEYCHMPTDEENLYNVSQLIELWEIDCEFDLLKRFDLVYQSSLGLEYLHSNNLVHKDIKPTNLLVNLVNNKIVVKLCDFDDIYDIKTRYQSTQTARGNKYNGFTICYLAPEICLGLQSAPTYQTDIYAWALTSYEILTGISPPWNGIISSGNDQILISALKNQLRPNLNELNERYMEFKPITIIKNLISSSWSENPIERGDLRKILSVLETVKHADTQVAFCEREATLPVLEEDQDTEAAYKQEVKSPGENMKLLLINGFLCSPDPPYKRKERPYETTSEVMNNEVSEKCDDQVKKNHPISNMEISDDISINLKTTSEVMNNEVSEKCDDQVKKNHPISDMEISDGVSINLKTTSEVMNNEVSEKCDDQVKKNHPISNMEISDDISINLKTTSEVMNNEVSEKCDDQVKKNHPISDMEISDGVSINLKTTSEVMNNEVSEKCDDQVKKNHPISNMEISDDISINLKTTSEVMNNEVSEKCDDQVKKNHPISDMEISDGVSINLKTTSEVMNNEVSEKCDDQVKKNHPISNMEISDDISINLKTTSEVMNNEVSEKCDDQVKGYQPYYKLRLRKPKKLPTVNEEFVPESDHSTDSNDSGLEPSVLKDAYSSFRQSGNEDSDFDDSADDPSFEPPLMKESSESDLFSSESECDGEDPEMGNIINLICDDKEDGAMSSKPNIQTEIQTMSSIKSFSEADNGSAIIDGRTSDIDNSDNSGNDADVDDENQDKDNSASALSIDICKRKSGHKKHHCLYCNRYGYANPRHLRRKHRNEEKVQDVLKRPENSIERKHMWQALSREGDSKANIEALKKNSGKLVVVRQSENMSVDNVVICPHCNGFFSSRTLYKHERCCFMKIDPKVCSKGFSVLKTSRALLDAATLSDVSNENVHRLLLSTMKRDSLHIIIRNDSSIMLYGAVRLRKITSDRYKDIRYDLRILARLLSEFRKIKADGTAEAKDLVLCENFDQTLQAALNISKYDNPRQIQTPSIILNAGHCIRRLSEYLKALALRKRDQLTIDKIRNFTELYNIEWLTYSSNAKATYNARKANMPEKLPLEEDVKKFRSFIVEEIGRLTLKEKTTQLLPDELRYLSKLTLARTLTFNARRGGEVSKLTMQQWEGVECDRWKRSSDIEKINNPVEKTLALRLKLCYLEGKKKVSGSSTSSLVPILFTEEVVQSIRILNRNRDEVDINSSNQFVFACGKSYRGGWDTLQDITKDIEGLKEPKLITPTRTRKYLATMLQLLDMNDADLTILTNHFGHSKDIHMSWYRKEDSTLELTKAASVLLAVDEGRDISNKKISNVLNSDSAQMCGGENAIDFETCNEETTESVTFGVQATKTINENGEKSGIPPKKKTKKKNWISWKKDDEDLLRKLFRSEFIQGFVPSLYDVRNRIRKSPELLSRGETVVRNKIRNMLKKEGKTK